MFAATSTVAALDRALRSGHVRARTAGRLPIEMPLHPHTKVFCRDCGWSLVDDTSFAWRWSTCPRCGSSEIRMGRAALHESLSLVESARAFGYLLGTLARNRTQI